MINLNLKRKRVLLLALLLLVSTVFTGCNLPINSVVKGIKIQDTPLDVWSWDIVDTNKLSTQEKLWKYGVDEISVNIVSSEVEEFLPKNNGMLYVVLMTEGFTLDTKVNALISNPDFALRENDEKLKSYVEDVIRFNNRYRVLFNAVNLDIEPYALSNWEGNEKELMNSYIENIKKVKSDITHHNRKTDDDLKLILTIPHWFSESKYNINGENVVDILLANSDGLTVKGYTNNQDKLVKRLSDIFVMADKHDEKEVKVIMDFKSDNEYVTLKDLKPEKLIDYASNSIKEFEKYKSFNGLSVNDYELYEDYAVENDLE